MFEIGLKSDRGRIRHLNQDSAYAAIGELDGEEYALLAVADGMGGHQAGEVASRMAIEHLTQTFAEGCSDADKSLLLALESAVLRSNQEIYERARSDYRLSGMGTTLTAAVLWRGQLQVAHVGDSRLYLCRDEACRQLTDDHSLVGELLRSGNLSEIEAQKHPQRNVLLRALGTSDKVKVDLLTSELRPGDVVLLCSDGLSIALRQAEVATIIGKCGGVQEAADLLVETANERGGLDNITVALAEWRWDRL